jgi:GDP-mannose 4,6-dehydratase
MKILVTGLTGFMGSHIAEYILNLNQNHEIFGITRWRSPKENLCGIINRVKLLEGNLLDLSSIIRIVEIIKPNVIFHLAAQSYVQSSFTSPIETFEINVIGTVNLLEAIRLTKQDPIVMVCSSSEVYGQVNKDEVPIKETCQFRPASPYAASKCAEDMIALQYFLSYGIKTIRTRAFTHTGPRRGDTFAMSSFAKQIAAIEFNLNDIIRVGNLDSVRTFCDIRDMARAYWMLVNLCEPGEVYNIGGTEIMTIREALSILLSFSREQIRIEVDLRRLRTSDVTLQIPDVSKFKSATFWEPIIPINQTLDDLLKYWRIELRKNPWKFQKNEN